MMLVQQRTDEVRFCVGKLRSLWGNSSMVDRPILTTARRVGFGVFQQEKAGPQPDHSTRSRGEDVSRNLHRERVDRGMQAHKGGIRPSRSAELPPIRDGQKPRRVVFYATSRVLA